MLQAIHSLQISRRQKVTTVGIKRKLYNKLNLLQTDIFPGILLLEKKIGKCIKIGEGVNENL